MREAEEHIELREQRHAVLSARPGGRGGHEHLQGGGEAPAGGGQGEGQKHLHDRVVGGGHLEDLPGDARLRLLVLRLHAAVVVGEARERRVAEEHARRLGLQEGERLDHLLVGAVAHDPLVLARHAQHVAVLRRVLELQLRLVEAEDGLHLLVVPLDLLVRLALARAERAERRVEARVQRVLVAARRVEVDRRLDEVEQLLEVGVRLRQRHRKALAHELPVRAGRVRAVVSAVAAAAAAAAAVDVVAAQRLQQPRQLLHKVVERDDVLQRGGCLGRGA